MPDELPLEYESIAPLFTDQPLPVTLPIEKEAEPPKPQPKSQPTSAPAPTPKADKKDEKKTVALVAESKPVTPEGFQEMRRYEETPFPDEKNEYKEPDPSIPKFYHTPFPAPRKRKMQWMPCPKGFRMLQMRC